MKLKRSKPDRDAIPEFNSRRGSVLRASVHSSGRIACACRASGAAHWACSVGRRAWQPGVKLL